MKRIRHIATGLVALVALAGIVVAVPWALVRYVGWPLPHGVPTWHQFTTSLTHHGISNHALIDVLAIAVWLTWATFAIALAVELPATVAGRTTRHVRGIGPAQALAAHLVAAVIVGALAVMPQPAPATHAAPLATSLAINQPHPVAPTSPLPRVVGGDPPSTDSTNGRHSSPSYVVQRGDTLWSIAAGRLGDPLRWRDIYALNEGRRQADGRVLDSPHWIYPGWTLLLPVPAATGPEATPAAPPTAVPAPASPQPVLPQQNVPSSPVAPTPTADPGPTPTSTPQQTDATRQHEHHAPAWVDLPSGSRIGTGFVAGILAALATQQLRRRRRYRPRQPAPGPAAGNDDPPRQPAALRDLLTVLHDRGDDGDAPLGDNAAPVAPLTATPADDARLQPDRIAIGSRGDQTVQLALADWPGLTLTGVGAEPTVRAWLATLVTCAGPYAAHLLVPAKLAERLLPGLSLPGLVVVDDATAVVARLEAERVGRIRLLDDAELPDAAAYREQNPEDPLPLLVAVVDDVPAELAARWKGATSQPARLAIAGIAVAPHRDGDEQPDGALLRVAADGVIEQATPAELAQALDGVRAFRLAADEAGDLLAPIAAAQNPDDDEPVSPYLELAEDAETAGAPVAEAVSAATPGWPAPSPDADPLIRVRVLGPSHVEAWGRPVTSGLRASAYEILAYYLLRPDGATAEAAIDAIWPDLDLDRGRQRFWTALGNLRSRLRGPDGQSLDVITKVGAHYRPDPEVLDVDLWHFQHALADATSTREPEAVIAALEQAVAAYGGDLCPGADYLWAEADREDLHRRALDAHLRLAELHAEAAHADLAIATLECAIQLDPVCEEAYRRLIALQGRLGRADAVRRTWHLLRGRLAELDLEPEPSTATVAERAMRGPKGVSASRTA